MERRVFALRCRKQCDDDADGAENVRRHGDDLILGDILRVELCGVICRVIHRLLGIDRLLVYGLLRVNRRLGLLAAPESGWAVPVPLRAHRKLRRKCRFRGSVLRIFHKKP